MMALVTITLKEYINLCILKCVNNISKNPWYWFNKSCIFPNVAQLFFPKKCDESFLVKFDHFE